jgi:hypothetical protein
MLFMIEDLEDGPTYDCNVGFLVRAKSENQARKIASRRHGGDESPEKWLDPKRSSCERVRVGGQAGILMVDFHAG